MTTPYEYLTDEMTGGTVLSTRLDWCIDNPDEDVMVYVCLYRIVKRKKQNRAFLSFWMEKSGGQYTFPSFVYSAHHSEMDDEEEEEVDMSLKLACIEKLVDVRSLQQDLATNGRATLGYKGLVCGGNVVFAKGNSVFAEGNSVFAEGNSVFAEGNSVFAKGNVVFAIFDADELEKTFSQSKSSSKSVSKSSRKCAWVILDEILRRKSVHGLPVDPVITEMFQKNPILQKLKSEGQPVEPPHQLYLVVVDPDAEEPYTTHSFHKRNAVMELPHRFADRFDNRFLLTEHPLGFNPSGQEPEWIRYAAFLEKPAYVFDRETITPQKREHYADLINKYSHEWDPIESTDDNEWSRDHRNVPCISLSDRIGSHPLVDAWGLTHRNQFVRIDEE